jgi:hypothetical protein
MPRSAIKGFYLFGLVLFVFFAFAVNHSQGSGADVTNGLVGYYKLDEATGTVAHDSSGFGYDGTVTGPAGSSGWRPTGGKINGAWLNYSNSIDIPSNVLNNFTGDFSIALWVNTNNAVQALAYKNVPSAGVGSMIQGYRFGIYGTTLQMYLDGVIKSSKLPIIPDQWTHVAVVKSGTSLTFYVNGVADTPITVPAAVTPTNSPLVLSVGGGGLLDDVRLYDRALSGAEVQTVMNSDGSYVGAPQAAPPSISSFAAAVSSINAGQSTTLAWAVTGAANVSIDNGVGSQANVAAGSVTVSPQVTTTYTLTASNGGGTVTSLATVVVNNPVTYATNVVITSPAANAVISGNMNLAASVSNLPGVAGVEYFFDNRPLPNLATSNPVGLLSSPYAYTWNSNNEWDGYGYLTAEALDSSGNVLSTSAPVSIQIANGSYTLQQTAPLAGQAVSGIINWTMASGSNTPAGNSPQCFVDGITVPNYSTYDTTQLQNGVHDFHCLLMTPGGGTVLAMSSVPVTVDNGRVPMQLHANFNMLYLVPGQSQNLSANQMYTDGSQSPVSATYSVDNSSVATVNSNGLVTAVGLGTATITVTSGGEQTTVQVVVNASHILPQFTKSGQMVTSYQPGSSLFVKSIFQGPTAGDFQEDPKLAGEVSAAGVNTLETGAYYNPVDGGGYSAANNYAAEANTLSSFEGFTDYENTGELSYASADNFNILLTGDELGRNVNEMLDSVFDPYSTPKIQYTMQFWKNSGKALGISMIDEVDSAWGCNPFDSTPGYWNQWSPMFTSSPLSTLTSIIDAVPHPNISWPTIGIGSPVCLGNWQGNPNFADFTNLYWDGGGWFYKDGESLYENKVNVFNQKFWTSLPYMQTNKPMLTEVQFTGPDFTKNVVGTGFVPGVDTLYRSGQTPQGMDVDIFAAIARGAAGVRLFSWGNPSYLTNTLAAGSGNNFFGISPYYGVAEWDAMSAAFNLEKVLEPYVLSPMTNALDLGPYVETGAHTGPYGTMFIAINDLDGTQTIYPNLGAYATGSSVTRYLLNTSQVTSQNLGAVTSDQVTLQPGEVAVYLFPAAGNVAPAVPAIQSPNPSSYGTTPITVSLTTPVEHATVSGTISIVASVADTAGTPSVQFMVDGSAIGSPVATSPYQISWNTNSVASGTHYITAFVKDNAGNQTVSNAALGAITVSTTSSTVISSSSISGTGSASTGSGGGGAASVPAATPPPPAPISVSSSSAPAAPPVQKVFLRNLAYGTTGHEVTLLQQLLFEDGDYPADLVTGYYGPLTEAAVRVFQAKYGIVSYGTPYTTGYGAVGPRTRAQLNAL